MKLFLKMLRDKLFPHQRDADDARDTVAHAEAEAEAALRLLAARKALLAYGYQQQSKGGSDGPNAKRKRP